MSRLMRPRGILHDPDRHALSVPLADHFEVLLRENFELRAGLSALVPPREVKSWQGGSPMMTFTFD